MIAIADEGERATARHATMSAIAPRCAALALDVKDMYGAAARRLHDETKAAKMRLCKLEAAAIEALQLKLYSRAADAFEAVATASI